MEIQNKNNEFKHKYSVLMTERLYSDNCSEKKTYLCLMSRFLDA